MPPIENDSQANNAVLGASGQWPSQNNIQMTDYTTYITGTQSLTETVQPTTGVNSLTGLPNAYIGQYQLFQYSQQEQMPIQYTFNYGSAPAPITLRHSPTVPYVVRAYCPHCHIAEGDIHQPNCTYVAEMLVYWMVQQAKGRPPKEPFFYMDPDDLHWESEREL